MGDALHEQSRHEALIAARYAADRAHELQLDTTSAQYETALLQVLFVLNGGSATAFLALAGSNLRDLMRTAPLPSFLGIGSWLLGLLVALGAGIFAYSAQRLFMSAARARRKAAAARFVPDADPELLDVRPGETAAELEAMANLRQRKAERLWTTAVSIGFASVALFTGGLAFAAWAIWVVSRPHS